ncbi:MAG: peptide deformylase [Verrucomicrobia bacterium]|nr:peptide deformylase [Verrucomicrobiota bacterium]MBS0637808.1 peptide deformylase [Verrucomicrobiota bacterium]
MKLPLFYYDHPILRQKALLVTEVTDEIRQLIRDMEETMDAAASIGISANQVGKLLSVCLVRYPIEDEYGNYSRAPTKVYINPKLSNPTKQTWVHDEGCLSIPKLYVDVERPVGITVVALDENGNEFTEQLTGWAARVLMHENDHLNGKLFIDRLTKKQRNQIDPALRAIDKKYNR